LLTRAAGGRRDHRVRTLDHALHSGSFGGPALNATTVLARLMATFHHEDGSVAVEGLVTASTEEGPDFFEEEFRRDADVPDHLKRLSRIVLAVGLSSEGC
jgi:Peptidase dimerisation domain